MFGRTLFHQEMVHDDEEESNDFNEGPNVIGEAFSLMILMVRIMTKVVVVPMLCTTIMLPHLDLDRIHVLHIMCTDLTCCYVTDDGDFSGQFDDVIDEDSDMRCLLRNEAPM